MNFNKTYKSLCSPARFYLAISVFFTLLIFIQNLVNGNTKELCVGSYSCEIAHITLFFVFKALYIAFWTWLLDLFCKNGLKTLSWFLVLIPFLLFALGLAIIFYIALTHKKTKQAQPQH